MYLNPWVNGKNSLLNKKALEGLLKEKRQVWSCSIIHHKQLLKLYLGISKDDVYRLVEL
jgi:hypothetical protein